MKKVSVTPENLQYRIVETLESLQGEGWNTDMPAVFVRLGKCNLTCGWCDTDCLRFGMISLSDTLGRLKIYAARNIIITGGGPTIQPHLGTPLDALKVEGYFLCIETNGLKPVPSQTDYVVTSPEACYAVKHKTNCIAEADEVCIMASGDVVVSCKNMKHKIRARHYYLSPCEQNSVMSIYDTTRQIGLLNNRPDASVHRQLSVQAHRWVGAE